MTIDPQRLRDDIALLTRTPRPAESPALHAAREFVARELESAGWRMTRRPFTAATAEGIARHGVNLSAEHAEHPRGSGPGFLIGAHLDSRPETPGADDNASAVAALLEIARRLPAMWPAEPALGLELVVFDLEEHGMLGGAQRAREIGDEGIDLRGMVSLEMLGYCDHRPGSQQLPPQLRGLYPDVGDFIGVVGNQNSERLVERFRAGLQSVPGLPVQSLAVPMNGLPVPETRLSDHSPFWDAGYPARMITDTSFLRNPHYHLPSDTLETLDLEFLAKVTQGCLEAVRGVLAAGL